MDISPQNFVHNTTVVSRKQYDEHLKLYYGYVDKVNQITNDLDKKKEQEKANVIYSKYRGLKESETFALDGVILHESYFRNMTNNRMNPLEKTQKIIDKYFGNYKNFCDDFMACSKSTRGWCILFYEQRTSSLRNLMLDAHNKGIVCMAFPLIVLDMYEHAYFLDYGTDKQKYIEKFLEFIDWDTVERRVIALDGR